MTAVSRVTCTRRLEWDAGHRVQGHDGKCRTPHGHRYTAEVTCAGPALTPEGFVVDFGKVKEAVGAWIDANWDHTTLYEQGDEVMSAAAQLCADSGQNLRPFYCLPVPPTAEHLARILCDVASQLLARFHVTVLSVRVYETPNCWADAVNPIK